jgi:cysteine desulfurase family protein
MIYFDSAATSFHKPECVARAVYDAIHGMGSVGRGAHEATLSASRTVSLCREQLATLFHCPDSSRVAFTMNSTESLNIAINGLFHPGDHVITTALEHNSVLRPLYRLEKQGLELTIIPADRQGRLEPDGFAKAIRPNTKGIVCTHASNVLGDAIDVASVGALCKEKGILLVVDASQSAGIFDIDMVKMNIDVLCFTGHKSLMGPQGTGGICVMPGVQPASFKVGGSGVHSFEHEHPQDMPTALEAGTMNAHSIAGLSAALTFIEEQGLDKLRERELSLARRFYEGVKDIPGVIVYGNWAEGGQRSPIVALNIGDNDAGAVSDALSVDYGICTRPGAHCAPLVHEALGTVEQGIVRFSFSHFNTEEEIDTGIRAIRELAED